jgi:TolB-like protein/Tfp pilus assembly protein PilF
MPESGDASAVFISYASRDAAVANSIVTSLELHGFKCWIAPRDVVPGTLYADEIVGAINDATVVVVMLSEHAIASPHVGKEIERASAKRRPIISVHVDSAPLTRAFEYFLSESQWIEVASSDVDGAAARVIAAVARHVRSAGAEKPATEMATAATPLLNAKSRAPAALAGAAATSRGRLGIAVLVAAVAAALIVLGVSKPWLARHDNAGEQSSDAATVAIDKSIAVLPFVDMSERRDQEYFADGMAEEILDLLAKLPGIRVIGRTSSFQFKGKAEDLRTIGQMLGAAYIVEGSVRRSGSRLRVTAQLIGTGNGSHLWSETYDVDVSDVLKAQDQIAAGLVRALQVSVGADELRPRPMLRNTESYDLYLRGRHALDRFDKSGHESAIGYFQQALDLDPASTSSAEWLALALEDMPEFGWVPPREGYERARASVERGLALNPNSAQLHSVMAVIHAIYDWDWSGAVKEAQRALALDPRHPQVLVDVGQVFFGLGDWDEAGRLLGAAVAVDPLSAPAHLMLASNRLATRRLVEAEAESRRVLQISPTFTGAHSLLGTVLLEAGRSEEALAEVQREPGDFRVAYLAIVYHRMGRKAESDAALAEYTKAHADDDAYDIATAHAYRNEVNQAFAWLDRAYRQRDPSLYQIKGDPNLAPIRADPRYEAFLRRMNFAE